MTQCEAVLSSVFLVIAPIAIAYLAHASKRSYLEMARSLIDYVKHYEERNSEEQVGATGPVRNRRRCEL